MPSRGTTAKERPGFVSCAISKRYCKILVYWALDAPLIVGSEAIFKTMDAASLTSAKPIPWFMTCSVTSSPRRPVATNLIMLKVSCTLRKIDVMDFVKEERH